MKNLNEAIDEEFLEGLADSVVHRLVKALSELDLSLDYIAAALTDSDTIGVDVAQAGAGRYASPGGRRRIKAAGEEAKE